MLIRDITEPICGWNSYDCYGGGITETEAMDNLKIFIERLKPHAYDYFCLDAAWYADGNQALQNECRKADRLRTMHMDEYGRFIPSPINFPGGLRNIADCCHEAGIKFGVHIMRGMPLLAVHRNTKIKGTEYRARDIYDPDTYCSWCKYWVGTHASHPGTRAYYRSEIEYLTEELHVDFIKLDDVIEHPDHVKVFGEELDRVARPVILSLSPGNELDPEIFREYSKYANLIRITPDAWDDDSTNLLKLQRWYLFEKSGSDNCCLDMDMLPLGKLQVSVMPDPHDNAKNYLGCARQSLHTLEGKQMLMTICAMSRSPLIFGGDLTQTPEPDMELATHPEVLRCNRDQGQARRVYFARHIDVRKKPKAGNDKHGWLGIFNVDQNPRRIRFAPGDLGFRAIPEMSDIWGDYQVSTDSQGNLEMMLFAKSCCFLRY